MSLLEAFLEDGLEESQIKPSDRKEVWFAIRSDGAKGRGTSEDPYNGSELLLTPQGQPPILQFDSILESADVPANTTIHLGPGIFKTGGGEGTSRTFRVPWRPKSGQRIVGSGMFATTLQLALIDGDTAEVDPDVHFFAVGGPNADFASYEISDLTIDCNMAGQPPTVINQVSLGYAKACCGAIRLFGKNLKIHRVRAINWGRRGAQLELFPLVAVAPGLPQHAAEEMSNVIEDCIIEQPDWNTGDQATLISAQVIRNCFVRGDRVRPGPFPQIPVLSLTYSGDRVTLKTPFSHQLTTDDRITVRGVMVGGQLSTLFNGNFDVDAVPSPKTLEYLLSESGSGTPTGTITVERESKPTLKVKSLFATQVGSDYVATLETYEPDNRTEEDWIVVSGVLDANGLDNSLYNRAFAVDGFDPQYPNKLKYVVGTTNPGTDAIVEDNVVNLGAKAGGGDNPPDNAVQHDNSVAKLKVFNNQQSDGVFLPVYDVQTGKHDWELTTEAEDAFLVR